MITYQYDQYICSSFAASKVFSTKIINIRPQIQIQSVLFLFKENVNRKVLFKDSFLDHFIICYYLHR